MTDGIKDVHRAAIIATLAANDHVERAVLFGSRATGTNTVSSDVDIALFGDRLTLTDQARLAAALDEIPMAQSVDLLLYDSIQDRTLRGHIRRQGVEWYARPARDESRNTASESDHEWPVVKLEDVSSDETGSIAIGPFGSRMKSDVYTPSGVPVIRGTNISSSRAWRNEWVYVSDDFADGQPNCNVREGDLVFPHRGSIGEVAIVPGDRARYILSTSLMKFRPDPEKVSALFLFYYFRSEAGRAEIMRYSSQVGTPGIGQPLASLRQFRVPIPPRGEQERIAGTLSVLDEEIELNRRMNATLEAMARALFRSWFVNFDPVRAKVEGRDIDLPADIAGLFPDRLVDSELGEIPEGWMPGTLADIVSLNPESWGTSDPPQAVAYVDLSNTKWGYIERVEVYPWEEAPSRARRVLRKGDTIVATVRPGNGSFALIDEDGLTGSTGFAVLRPRRIHDRELVWCAVTSASSIDRLAYLADGGAYPAVRPDAVLETSIVLSDCSVRKAFASSTAGLLDRIETNKRASRALASLRDVLLPRLVSGELRVPVANRPYGERCNG